MRFAIVISILFASACGEILDSTVTITQTGGTGTITASDGQTCSDASCAMTFPQGATITLTATDSAGSQFVGWTGACARVGPCTLELNDDMTVGAEFTLTKIAVTVEMTGGGARITSSPAGIDCGTTCTATYDFGTTLTLTAQLTPGTTFTGWSGGGCSGTGSCETMVSEAATITAQLGCESGSQTFDYMPAVQELTLPACARSVTIDAYGAQGGTIGNFPGGKGARIQGTFAVSDGPTLFVIVGGQGAVASQNSGGGGGSFVYHNAFSNTPLIAAGGGGGITTNGGCQAGPGAETIAATNSTGGAGNGTGGSPGFGGGGGTMAGAPGSPGTGGGGTGFRSSGSAGTVDSRGGGGQSPRAGAAGGVAGTSGAAGGYGGGGGSAGSSGAGGGGGGYAGGGGGNGWSGTAWGCGGGGGSFNGGTDQTNEAGIREGNGQVIITW